MLKEKRENATYTEEVLLKKRENGRKIYTEGVSKEKKEKKKKERKGRLPTGYYRKKQVRLIEARGRGRVRTGGGGWRGLNAGYIGRVVIFSLCTVIESPCCYKWLHMSD